MQSFYVENALTESIAPSVRVATDRDIVDVAQALLTPLAYVANPPFALQADIKHTLHAMRFLKPSAPLVTVMSAGIKYRNTKLAQSVRDLVARTGGSIVDLPESTFSESGTEAHTVLVKLYNR